SVASLCHISLNLVAAGGFWRCHGPTGAILNMQRNPAFASTISIFCLLLAGAFSAALGAPHPRPRPKKTHTAKAAKRAAKPKHRFHIPFISPSDPGKDDVTTYDDP